MLSFATVAVCLLLTAGGSSEAVQKRWVRTWDLDSLDNWQERRLPCAGKAAILDRYINTSMFLGNILTLGSLELPLEGELIFGEGANMVFDHTVLDDCKDARWTHRGRDQWWDPDAWSYPGFDDPDTSPVPHINRIPCTTDGAVFTDTSGSLYRVHLCPPVISLTSLSIGNKNFTTSEFAAYTRSTEGKYRFIGVSSIRDNAPLYVESPEVCRDVTGCSCGTEAAASIICSIKSKKCVPPRCDSPIHMTGFCCPMCGAEVTISHNNTLPLANVVALLRDHLNTPAIQHVTGYVTKMHDGHFHVYFTAVNEKGNYKIASEAFIIKFNQELNVGGTHELLITNSGIITPSISKKLATNSVAVTLTVLAVCAVVALTLYHFKKRRATSRFSFMFHRLENSSRRVSVASNMGGRRASTTSSIFTYSREGGLRFFNPIFNQSMASLAGAGVTSVSNDPIHIPATEQVEGQRENPMYTAYQNMTPEERQVSEDAVRTRERILEAAGELSASTDALATHNKEMKTTGPSASDLEVIEEEDAKNDISDQHKETKENTERIDDNRDPLGVAIITSLEDQIDRNFLDDTNNTTKLEDHKENACTFSASIQEECSSDKSGMESEMTVKDPLDVDDNQSNQLTDRQQLAETNDTEAQLPRVFELNNSTSSSSSGDDTSPALQDLAGFTPCVNLDFSN
ncbi:hypothetical protein OTU49_000558 [Cherax quadricarinatus]|uniref:Protein amnionless n=1 Tax=Cherax quadricarinatus TaxID=27406 RepID=A0AAW0XLC1_CHEQU